MFDVVVGLLRLDVWADGRGVVSRMTRLGEPRGDVIPLDPEGFNFVSFVSTMRRVWVGCLIASAISWAGAIQLLRAGSVIIGIGVCLVALALAAVGVSFLFGWRIPTHRGRFVTLGASEAEEFKEAAAAEHRALGEKPKRDARNQAETRLWELACQLSSAQGRR